MRNSIIVIVVVILIIGIRYILIEGVGRDLVAVDCKGETEQYDHLLPTGYVVRERPALNDTIVIDTANRVYLMHNSGKTGSIQTTISHYYLDERSDPNEETLMRLDVDGSLLLEGRKNPDWIWCRFMKVDGDTCRISGQGLNRSTLTYGASTCTLTEIPKDAKKRIDIYLFELKIQKEKNREKNRIKI